MVTFVSRKDKAALSRDELLEIAALVRDIHRKARVLLDKINGRVLVRWIDPFCGARSALSYFIKLMYALDTEFEYRFGAPPRDKHGGTPFDMEYEEGQQPLPEGRGLREE